MEIKFTGQARQDFLLLDKTLKLYFKRHLEKLMRVPPRRHMKFGLPYHVEDVTSQARLVYEADTSTLFVVRCFSSHKDYEKWYKSFK